MQIGITIGDPNGIGPEIAIKVAKLQKLKKICDIVLVGEIEVLRYTAKKFNIKQKFVDFGEKSKAGIPVVECLQEKPTKIKFGKITSEAGGASISYVCLGGMLAQQKKIDALVTCPISKEAVINSGISDFTGHTEYLAELSGAENSILSYWYKGIRIAHVTSHVSLKDSIGLCTKENIVTTARLLNEYIRGVGIKKPVIGICGLNPHAGENGAYGDEEILQIIPAIKKLKRQGVNAKGPIPADIIFAQQRSGMYDGVVAMNHDQGGIALKTFAFSFGKKSKVGGVNVTLGLPFIRTSVDHGTSFDIAGKGIADTTSLVDAVELAVKLAKSKL